MHGIFKEIKFNDEIILFCFNIEKNINWICKKKILIKSYNRKV